jgi:2-polyprenyl-3-methyl-5-hydroxy-6-metoxy-1,4-benzoquinol methylase
VSPHQVSESTHWDEWNSRYRQPEKMIDEASFRRMHSVLDWLERLKIPDAKILEIGCGTGWLSSKLKTFGTVTGVDLGVSIIEAARRREPDIDFRSGDIFEVDLPLESFDIVVTLETLFCIPDQQKFIARAAELLNRHGWLLIATHNKFVCDRREDIDLPADHLRHWNSMRELKNMVNPYFHVVYTTTLEPRGHLGVLRIVNSSKVNRVLDKTIGPARAKHLKEALGLGQTLFLVAQKR